MPDSDSELEGVLTNVVRAIMRPPGHSGKAKRGHLCFDASFETGNLGRIDFVAEHEYDLFIRPDTSNPRFRFWFNFNVDNAQSGQLAIFNIVNLHTVKNLFAQGLSPLVRSTSRPMWQRLPQEQVYYHKSIEHRGGHLILSFSFCFDVETDVYQFALSYPYSYSRFQAFMTEMEDKKIPCCRRTCLAHSIMKRRCELLTITSPKNMTPAVLEVTDHVSLQDASPGLAYDEPTGEFRDSRTNLTKERSDEDLSDKLGFDSGKPSLLSSPRSLTERPNGKRVVVIVSRVHPSETPSSYVVQGMIELLSSDNDVASRLREHVVFKIIPMLNPDGVYLGNYRTTIMGVDLNRRWGVASPFAHPTLHATKSMILDLDKANWCELDLVLDLHATASKLGTFIYGNSYDDVYRHERHIVFPKMVSHACEDYAPENTIYNRDPHKFQSSRRWLCNKLKDSANVYSIHTSLLGYRESRDGPTIVYTEDSCILCSLEKWLVGPSICFVSGEERFSQSDSIIAAITITICLDYRVGRNLARAILDYYQFLGIIPFSLPYSLPLHDLPRLRPGSPEVLPSVKARLSSARTRSMADSMNRSKEEKYKPDSGNDHFTLSSDVFELSSDESSSDSQGGSNNESISEGSAFRVKIVQNPTTTTSSSSSMEKLYDKSDNVLNLRSFSPSKFAGSSRRIAAKTHVHVFPGLGLNEDTFNHPEKKTLLRSLQADTKGKTFFKDLSINKRRAPKNLTWKLPLAGGECPYSFRYFDFKKMTKSKVKKRRRKKKRPKSHSPSRSRSRSRSRHRSTSVTRRKPRCRKKKRTKPKKRTNQEPKSFLQKESENSSGSEDGQPSSSQKPMDVKPITGPKRIDFSKLAIGGYEKEANTVTGWQNNASKKIVTKSSKKTGQKTRSTSKHKT